MYTLRQRVLPALGKEAEVRAHVTEWVQQLRGKGRDMALSARLFSSEGPALVVSTRAEDLNALERYRKENLDDADWQARAATLLGLLRGPVQAVVAEVLVPVNGSGPVGIVQRAVGFPALGKERQLRSLGEEFVRASQAAGVRIGMAQRVFSATGAAYEVTSVFPDLAALERSGREQAARTGDAARAGHELSRAPIQVRLFEVLVPFAS